MPQSDGQKIFVEIAGEEEAGNDANFFSSLKQATEIEEHREGRLSVDVAESASEIIIIAPMAGALRENIELHLHNDLLTIRGERKNPMPVDASYHFAECYWGKFSRSIVLPADVHLNMARAEYRHGLLIVNLPKIKIDHNIPITIVQE
ncbi:MAG: Hsp20/alpha crystallin family protein [Patescibacteria group bacterium]